MIWTTVSRQRNILHVNAKSESILYTESERAKEIEKTKRIPPKFSLLSLSQALISHIPNVYLWTFPKFLVGIRSVRMSPHLIDNNKHNSFTLNVSLLNFGDFQFIEEKII